MLPAVYAADVIPMTYAPKTSTVNWLQFFRCQFPASLSCKSETGLIWYQIPALIWTLFYSKTESGVHVTMKQCTKVHNKHSSQVKVFICLSSAMHSTKQNIKLLWCCHFRQQKFSFQMNMVLKNGIGVHLWHWCLEHVSWWFTSANAILMPTT